MLSGRETVHESQRKLEFYLYHERSVFTQEIARNIFFFSGMTLSLFKFACKRKIVIGFSQVDDSPSPTRTNGLDFFAY